MELNLIEFLESKDASQELITRVINYSSKLSDVDVLQVLEKIYGIMEYINISDKQVERMLMHNISIISLPFSEIIKILYVINKIPYNKNLINVSYRNSAVFLNYKKMFVRNYVALKSGRYTYDETTYFLICSQAQLYNSGNFFEQLQKVFGKKVSITSDRELENELNKILKIGNEIVDVDKYIEVSAKKFYCKYLADKQKRKRGASK